MRTLLQALAFAAIALGQEPAPPGILRGQIVNLHGSVLELRTLTGVSYRCTIDYRTYIERDGQRIFSGALRPEDSIEMVADRNSSQCFARTIRVVRPQLLSSARRSPLPRPYRVFDQVFPRGNLTFSGVVRRISPEMLVLFTRTEPEKIVLLRDDTRYLAGGLPADFQSLAVNTRVFIRGGHNFENNLEAYQVVWGEIAGPKRQD